jgi:hypothetical protein
MGGGVGGDDSPTQCGRRRVGQGGRGDVDRAAMAQKAEKLGAQKGIEDDGGSEGGWGGGHVCRG